MPFTVVNFTANPGRNFVADLPPNTVAVAIKNDLVPPETAGRLGVLAVDYFIEGGAWQAQRYVAPVWWYGGMTTIEPPVGGAWLYFMNTRADVNFMSAFIYTDSFP